MNRCAHCYGDLPDFAVFCPHCARAYEPDFARMLHQTIGERYRLYRRLGQGGLSTVFAATDLQTDDVVVVKVSDPAQLVQRELSYAIDAEAARNYWGEMLERMRREAETLAEIDHPNIVQFYDTGLIGEDLRFVVMEFLRGRMLRDEMDAKGRLEPAAAIRIALEICEALREVHARGIVHRDISPRNIFLAEARTQAAENETVEVRRSIIKLIDFGIAKFPQPPGAPPFTQHSVLSGTVAYASPEQCQSRDVDYRSDIYSLGVVLYEMVTGQRLFTGRTPTEIALKQIQAEPVPPRQLIPDLPLSLERAILRTLAKNPDERPQTAELFAEELRASTRQIFIPLQEFQAADDDPAAGAMADSENEELIDRSRLVRRRRRRAALAAALVVVAAASGILFGKNWLTSQLSGSPLASLVTPDALPSPSPSSSPEATSSDPDALELAAQLSADHVPGATGNKAAQSLPQTNSVAGSVAGSGKVPEVKSTVSAAPTASTSSAFKTTPLPTLSGKPAKPSATPHAAVKASPPVPPPTPSTVAVVRAPQPGSSAPASKPEGTQTSRKTEDRDNPRQSEKPTENTDHNNSPQVARRDRVAANRQRDDGFSRNDTNSRRQPPETEASDDAQEGEDSQQLGPKLIQWSGSVNREREIVIDLPGKPGRLEIPRVYRNRVGMVEPPSPSNRWRSAKLRVFGQGGVSFVVRWWPEVVGLSRLAGH
jgi:serine/threonine protein kinase